MREFFGGWKRKAGCVTLALACVFMAGWVRSYQETDTFGFGINGSQQWIVSTNGSLLWAKPSETRGVSWGFLLNFNRLEVKYLLQLSNDRIIVGNYCLIKLRTIPYWTLVMPLILFSAYLLLSKPQPKHPERI